MAENAMVSVNCHVVSGTSIDFELCKGYVRLKLGEYPGETTVFFTTKNQIRQVIEDGQRVLREWDAVIPTKESSEEPIQEELMGD